jgi:hypothetical protein
MGSDYKRDRDCQKKYRQSDRGNEFFHTERSVNPGCGASSRNASTFHNGLARSVFIAAPRS